MQHDVFENIKKHDMIKMLFSIIHSETRVSDSL